MAIRQDLVPRRDERPMRDGFPPFGVLLLERLHDPGIELSQTLEDLCLDA